MQQIAATSCMNQEHDQDVVLKTKLSLKLRSKGGPNKSFLINYIT